VEIDKIDQFRTKFNQVVKESMNEDDLLPEIHIDSKLKFSEITPKFLRIIDQFSPFGPGNMRPVFLSENVEVVGSPRVVGSNHLVVSLRQSGSDKVFDCIGFNMGNFCSLIGIAGNCIDVVYTIDKTTRDGRTFPQFKFKDIRVREKISSRN
jgi:single-stranded-DNA-specific exonuclease